MYIQRKSTTLCFINQEVTKVYASNKKVAFADLQTIEIADKRK